MLTKSVDLRFQQHVFHAGTQALFTLLVFPTTLSQDTGNVRLGTIVVQTNKLVGLQPGAEFTEELLIIAQLNKDLTFALCAFVDAASLRVLAVISVQR